MDCVTDGLPAGLDYADQVSLHLALLLSSPVSQGFLASKGLQQGEGKSVIL